MRPVIVPFVWPYLSLFVLWSPSRIAGSQPLASHDSLAGAGAGIEQLSRIRDTQSLYTYSTETMVPELTAVALTPSLL